MYPPNSRGTTLVELMIATVISSIVAIGFSSVLMFTRNMYNDTMVRSQLSQDAYVVDQYVRTKLTSQQTDSLKIFASASDEDSDITSSSGVIMHSVRMDGTVDHLSANGLILEWKIDTLIHNPIDSDISELLFTERTGYSKKMLTVKMVMEEAGDGIELEWIVAIRN
ncbi:MAG: prepilin-type N-terminal cleavage/methylation domain-containing protein [Candidatus Marinimicrobia bacterium]|nr:prepilin-type N-terminal cleavage/methylation domain-containing protein [Candidatus Neomarinimicrobiota bacterium]